MSLDTRIGGIPSILGAVLILTAQDSLIKWFSGTYPLHEIIFVRALLASVLTLVLVRLEGGLGMLRTRRPGLHLARGLLVLTVNTCFFMALASMALADAVAIFFISPLLITGFSAAFLDERIGPRRWAAVGVGLLGVVVMLRPGGDVIQAVSLLPLAAACGYACLQILTRRLGVTDKASTMSFYIQITFIAVSSTIGIVAGDGRFAPEDSPSLEFLLRAWVVPSGPHLALFILIGVLNTVGGYLLSQAYRVAEGSLIAPFEYVALPLAVMWGVLMFGDWPDRTAVLGMVLIVGSGLYALHRETRLRAAARRSP